MIESTNRVSNKTLDSSQIIASRDHNKEQMGSLHWLRTELYKTKDGRWFTVETGGAAMQKDRRPLWLDRAEAIDFIFEHARDGITGYGYAREQAEIMVDGGDAGKGYREIESD